MFIKLFKTTVRVRFYKTFAMNCLFSLKLLTLFFYLIYDVNNLHIVCILYFVQHVKSAVNILRGYRTESFAYFSIFKCF